MEYYAINTSPSLSHHGILGQKWGVRRYQNKDGSLTPAGMKRYNKLVSEANKLKPPSENQNGNNNSNNNSSNNYGYNKELRNYSNEYLSRETQRLQLENNYIKQRNDTLRLLDDYSKLKNPPKQKSEGRKFVEALLKDVVKGYVMSAINNKKQDNDNNNNNSNNSKKKSKKNKKPKKGKDSISYYANYDVGHSEIQELGKDYLMHHGILGMKWGIRRYQNEDGSLTNAGKKRYTKYDNYAKDKDMKIANLDIATSQMQY